MNGNPCIICFKTNAIKIAHSFESTSFSFINVIAYTNSSRECFTQTDSCCRSRYHPHFSGPVNANECPTIALCILRKLKPFVCLFVMCVYCFKCTGFNQTQNSEVPRQHGLLIHSHRCSNHH